jgi:hypothetical protein
MAMVYAVKGVSVMGNGKYWRMVLQYCILYSALLSCAAQQRTAHGTVLCTVATGYWLLATVRDLSCARQSRKTRMIFGTTVQ